MAKMHELASASPPYERVPNILRYKLDNLLSHTLKIDILGLVRLLLKISKSIRSFIFLG